MKSFKQLLLILIGAIISIPFDNSSDAGKWGTSDDASAESSTKARRRCAPAKVPKIDKPTAAKHTSSKKKTLPTYATPENVLLKKGKGSPGRGGGAKGFYWSVTAWGAPAGKVFINWIDEPPIGPHASLQIFLNKKSQGKHIGRIVYEQACKLSSYQDVYAHIAKSNQASIKSARAAGFIPLKLEGIRQALLKWTRHK